MSGYCLQCTVAAKTQQTCTQPGRGVHSYECQSLWHLSATLSHQCGSAALLWHELQSTGDGSGAGGGFDSGTLHYTSDLIRARGLDDDLMRAVISSAVISADSLMTRAP